MEVNDSYNNISKINQAGGVACAPCLAAAGPPGWILGSVGLAGYGAYKYTNKTNKTSKTKSRSKSRRKSRRKSRSKKYQGGSKKINEKNKLINLAKK